jgi:hypothetical protein
MKLDWGDCAAIAITVAFVAVVIGAVLFAAFIAGGA